ncbi:MAG: hypothetical protein KDA80_24200 [Planctomycetaceae bacterium]|nr:hypothetical protein [Planctomycetaceae bacterium]
MVEQANHVHGRISHSLIVVGLSAVILITLGQLASQATMPSGVALAGVLVILGTWQFWDRQSGIVPWFGLSLVLPIAVASVVPFEARGIVLVLGTMGGLLGTAVTVSRRLLTEPDADQSLRITAPASAKEEASVSPASAASPAFDLLETDWEESEDVPRNLVQQVTRTCENGQERIDGMIRVRFPSGMRQMVLHVPFVPLLNSIPDGWCECESEQPIRAELDAIFKYGVRIVLRRSGSDGAGADALVCFSLETTGSRQKAA